jgi:Kef-type K+ transport system membrane component KefB
MPALDIAGVNIVAVLVTALTLLALGAGWYTVLFAERWPRWQLIPPERLESLGRAPWTTFAILWLCFLAMCFVIAWLWRLLGVESGLGGLVAGLLLALGTVVPFALADNRLQEKPPAAFAVDAGFQLMAFAWAGLILALWR